MGPPKMNGSRWRGLTECGPLEKGMANRFSILALKTPRTVWKGKKIGHWQMTWVSVGSGSWWWTGRPGGLQSMGSQKVRHHWATEQNIPSDPSPSPLQILSGSPLTIATEEADRTVEALSSCVQVCHYWLERKGRPLMMPPTDADVIMPPKRRVLKDVLWDVSQGPMGWRTSKVQ